MDRESNQLENLSNKPMCISPRPSEPIHAGIMSSLIDVICWKPMQSKLSSGLNPSAATFYRLVFRHSFFSSVYETTIVGMNPFSSWPNVVVTMWGSCQEQFRHQCVRITSEPKCWTLLELDRTKWSRNNVTLLSSTVFSTMRNAPYRLTVNCQTVTTMVLSVRQCLLQSATVR